MTNVNKQTVEKKEVQKVPLRGRFDIVVRKLQGEYSTANGWAITANNLVANQLTVVVERVAPNHATGGTVASTASVGGSTEDKIEVAKVSTVVDTTTEAPKTTTKRTTKTTIKKTED